MLARFQELAVQRTNQRLRAHGILVLAFVFLSVFLSVFRSVFRLVLLVSDSVLSLGN